VNVLVLLNLFPKNKNKASGIFITKRLKEYRKLGVEYKAVPLAVEDRGISMKLVRTLLKKPSRIPIESFEGVSFESVFSTRSFIDVFLQKCTSKGRKRVSEKLTDLFVNEILKNIHSEYDIIHAHGMYIPAPAGVVAKKLAEIWNTPYIVTLHGSDINLNMANGDVRDIYIETLEKASKCIFVSNALLENAKSFGYSGKNAVVIPNGYDPEIFKPMDKETVRKELGIYKEGYKYVGFVGNLIPIKRADKLPKIFHLIHQEIPETFFIVVGDGPLKETVKKRTKDFDILFTGRISQEKVAEYMNAMDVVILPSRSEGWPCAVLEAQACGTCVVGSNNGGIPEAIGFEECVVKEGKDFEERFARRVVEVLKKGYDSSIFLERVKSFAWGKIVINENEIYKEIMRDLST